MAYHDTDAGNNGGVSKQTLQEKPGSRVATRQGFLSRVANIEILLLFRAEIVEPGSSDDNADASRGAIMKWYYPPTPTTGITDGEPVSSATRYITTTIINDESVNKR